ncbi:MULTISPECIES: M23 family metallopeptidase [Exiguobacterium]|uniref:M23 family metallopeptidase n=1 Tax=Exiguobacterium TaxID=33986 RepID=UPI001BE4E579|nr:MULTISPECIES: peptidoglycan DD-metalloendopeptidase family protein [Exiguobacterium]MCT4776046.1 peptidoglycan DD-metalloendopeptidase family protein [Exiguobacterium aquaticum]MCT4788044.1 peptidoglycan DD-metalloendopeptidase family protein [Exiguobacterium mexicanum]
MKKQLMTITLGALLVSGLTLPASTPVEASTSYKVKVTTNVLNVRTGPATTYQKVGSATLGQTFKYLGATGSWTKISYNGSTKYVASTYVKKYSAPFIMPTKGTLTQGYGPANGKYGYTFHNGIDLAAAKGTPVQAAATGQVIVARNYGAYGNHVMISHTINGQAYTSVYAHMDRLNVVKGQTIAKGANIGTVGNTGNSFGSHLHFEIHKNKYVYSSSTAANSVNPYTLF